MIINLTPRTRKVTRVVAPTPAPAGAASPLSANRRARFLVFVVLVAAALAVIVASWPQPKAKPVAVPAKPVQAPVAEATVATVTGGYFATALLDQQKAESRELALDEQVQADAAATASVRAAAAARVVALGRRQDQEAEIRALLLAKGYPNAVVYLNNQPASAVVVLEASHLLEADAVRAADAVERVAGVPAADISVMAHR